MQMPFTTEIKLQEEIERRIKDHESSAEEYFQETENEAMGNERLGIANELKDLLKWMEANL